MADISKLTVGVSVEKVAHDVISDVLNMLATKHGLVVRDINIQWHGEGSLDGKPPILGGVTLTTDAFKATKD